jgi:hypothetical protein
MPTQPTVDTTKYRQVQFQGGRILQAREVSQVQNNAGDQPSKGSFVLGALYSQGATLNVLPVITNGSGSATITLQAKTALQPTLVFVNNRFEQIPAGVSMTVAQGAENASFACYVNWVLWRVTATGDRGSLTDPTLVDATTGETVAEMGQLQIYCGADDSGPVPAPTGTSYTILARNTAPILMFAFQWKSGLLTYVSATSAVPGAAANAKQYGLVTTTTDNSIVASTDDARLANTRIPTDLSVKTQHVSALVNGPTPSLVTWANENGAQQSASFPNATTTGGVTSDKLYYPTWQVSLSDAIAACWGRIQNIFTVLQGYGSRIVALENGAANSGVGWHIGKYLGRKGPNIDTHPPVVDCTDPATAYAGFTVIGSKAGGNPYTTVRGDGVTLNSYVYVDGNFVLSNPDFQGALNGNVGGQNIRFDNLLGIGAFLLGFAQKPNLRGDSIITGIVPVGVAKGVWIVMNIGNNNFGFNSGWQIAFGSGFGLNNGETVQLPPGWTESDDRLFPEPGHGPGRRHQLSEHLLE